MADDKQPAKPAKSTTPLRQSTDAPKAESVGAVAREQPVAAAASAPSVTDKPIPTGGEAVTASAEVAEEATAPTPARPVTGSYSGKMYSHGKKQGD